MTESDKKAVEEFRQRFICDCDGESHTVAHDMNQIEDFILKTRQEAREEVADGDKFDIGVLAERLRILNLPCMQEETGSAYVPPLKTKQLTNDAYVRNSIRSEIRDALQSK